MIQRAIADLVCYGRATGLISREDSIYTANRLLELLQLDTLEEDAERAILEFEAMGNNDGVRGNLENILNAICNFAFERGLIEENTVTYRDLFDTKVMGLLTDRPGNVVRRFQDLYRESPQKATDWFYRFCRDTDYIRTYRVAKDLRWKTATEYGELDITINLSKPEKDPKAIAAAALAPQGAYPKCQLCRENVGYAGRINHPARQTHRIIPVNVGGYDWYFQYSPYVYYNEHCIVFNGRHMPMKIDRGTFTRLLDFEQKFPHYFIGSNADLPIVGGSILSHDHFQGGHYDFAMAKAPVEKELAFAGYEDIKAGIVKWPMSVIRLRGAEPKRIVDLADKILQSWRDYTDEKAGVYARTGGKDHNTITPIARRRGEEFELDLVLRCNITTPEHPMGVFHPHEKLHHIKKENIGLIEVMGLAVLPARLKAEIEALKAAILGGKDLRKDPALEKHADWVEEFSAAYDVIDETNIEKILQDEIGKVFMEVLTDAGVYKRTEEGMEQFLRFADAVNQDA